MPEFLTGFLEVHEPLGDSTVVSRRAFLDQQRIGKKVPRFFRCERIPDTFYLREARGHATIRDFPLATTTVGWVPDRTPAGPKRSGGLEAKRRVVRAGCRLRMQLRGNNIGLVTLIMNFVCRVLDPMRIVCSPDRIDGFSVSSSR